MCNLDYTANFWWNYTVGWFICSQPTDEKTPSNSHFLFWQLDGDRASDIILFIYELGLFSN